MKTLLILFSLLAFHSHAQQGGAYFNANKSGCKIWLDEAGEGDSLTWNGECKDGFAAGKGFMQWYQHGKLAATYRGGMKAGKFDGQGRFEILGYGRFDGRFVDGSINGKGAAYFNNGGKTIGNFVDGNFLNLDDSYLKLLKKQQLPLKNSSGIYNYAGAEDQLFYYLLLPKGSSKGVLILFPSTGESAENVISCNRVLMQQAYDHQITTVVVSVNFNKTLDRDTSALEFFDLVFKDLVSKHKLSKDKFILSGLSLGGMNALQYTEMSRNPKYDTYIKPLAVVGIDPPVDMADLYYGAERAIVKYEKEGDRLSESKKLALKESYFLVDEFKKQYGGSPEEFPEKYVEGSMFSRSREDGGNARFLVDVPVRLYCDPDIVWQLKNKGRDYYDLNAANLSAMTKYLMEKGNQGVEFIPAIGKGFRVDGTRHPHSWSIAEPADLIRWILKLAK